MSLTQAKPKTTNVKKWIIFGAGGILIAGVVLILTNLMLGIVNNKHKSEHDKDKSKQYSSKVVTSHNPDWIDTHQVKKATIAANQTQTTASTTTPYPSTDGVDKKQQDDQVNKEIYQKAMAAPIGSNQINPSLDTNAEKGIAGQSKQSATQDLLPNGMPPAPRQDLNQQAEKKAFLQINSRPTVDDYLSSKVNLPKSPYEIKAGTVIPGILITGINSDLPGQVTAQVRNHVYDTITGNHLLIPQGTKMVGLYDSAITYGQERVSIVWRRLIFPNGQSIDLQGMPGADVSGYSGFNDKVNNHYVRIFGSTIVMSALAAGAQLSQPKQESQNPFAPPSVNQTLAQNLGMNIAGTGNALLAKNLGIQPTLEIRPGYLFNITVTKDVIFPQPYSNTVTFEGNN